MEFVSGETTKTIRVPIRDDVADDHGETFDATLTNAISFNGDAVTLATATATQTINDDSGGNDTDVTFAATVTGIDGTEGAGNTAGFTIDLGAVNNTGGDITVFVQAFGNEADSSDYTTAFPTSVVIPNGQQTADIDLDLAVGDGLEGDETLSLAIVGSDYPGVTAGATGTHTVTDAESTPTPPTVTILGFANGTDAAARDELDNNQGDFTDGQSSAGAFVVDLGEVNNTGGDITVTYILNPNGTDTATGGTTQDHSGGSLADPTLDRFDNSVDYLTPTTLAVVIPDGQQTAAINIHVLDDMMIEGTETVSVRLDTAVRVDGGPVNVDNVTVQTLSIQDQDVGDFSHNNDTIDRDDATFDVRVELTANDIADTNGNGRVIFEKGGGTGTGLVIEDGNLVFGWIGGIGQTAPYDLNTDTLNILGGSTADTIPIFLRGTIDMANGANDTIELFMSTDGVNYTSIGTAGPASNGDWDGGDGGYFGQGEDLGENNANLGGFGGGFGNGTTNHDADGDGTFSVFQELEGTVTGFDIQGANGRSQTISVFNVESGTEGGTATVTLETTNFHAMGQNSGTRGDIVVFYDIVHNEASNLDYDTADLSGSFTVPHGQQFTDVVIDLPDDTFVEGTESLQIILTGTNKGFQANVDPTPVTLDIFDNDGAVVSLTKISDGVDGASGTEPTAATFGITLGGENQTGGDITVTYTLGGTAANGTDYVSIPVTAVIPQGTSTLPVTIPVIDDTAIESDESIVVTITNAVDANGNAITFSNSPLNLNIADGDGEAKVTISTDGPVDEGGTLTVTLTLDQDVPGGFKVTPEVLAQTGQAADFATTAAQVTFAGTAGESHTFTITPTADGTAELAETLHIILKDLVDATTDQPSQGLSVSVNTLDTEIVVIRDSDGPVVIDDGDTVAPGDVDPDPDPDFVVTTISNADTATLKIEDIRVTEGSGGGSTTITAVIGIDQGVQGGFAVEVTSAISGGTAEASDFTAETKTVNFTGAIGETQEVTFTVAADDVVELDETFTLTLGSVTPTDNNVDAADITTGDTATVTILDDDTARVTVGDISVNEAAGTVDVTLTLDNAVEGGFTLTGTGEMATAEGADFTAVPSAVSNGTSPNVQFAGTAGETQTLTFDITDDAIVEGAETFVVHLSGLTMLGDAPATSVDISDTGTVTINESDTATLAIGNVVQSNEEGIMTFDVVLTGDVEGGFHVDVGRVLADAAPFTGALAAGADNGDILAETGDVGDFNRTLDFEGTTGETVTVTVPLNNELIVEGDETFTVALSNVVLHEATPAWTGAANTPVILPTAPTTLTINNTDQATVLIEDVVVREGDGAGTTDVTVTLSVDHAVEGAFSVQVTPSVPTAAQVPAPFTHPDNAAEASDFVAGAITANFLGGIDGETTTIMFSINNDDIVELDEIVHLALSNPAVAAGSAVDPNDILVTDTASVTIRDNDAAQITIANVTVNESDGTAVLTLVSNATIEGGIQVTVQGQEGTAELADFGTAAVTSAVFAATDATRTTTVNISITNDQIVEGTESFLVSMTGVTSAAGLTGLTESIDISDTATVTINDNDSAAVTIADVTVNENAGFIQFILQLDQAVEGGFTVDTVLTDGTATGGSTPGELTDFPNTSQTLQFQGTANETVNVSIPIHDDALLEAAETFTIGLSNLTMIEPSTGATVNISDTATGTITNDDAYTVRVRPHLNNTNNSTISEGGGTAPITLSFEIELSGPNTTGQPITVFYNLTGGTAKPIGPNPDFTASSLTSVTIPALVAANPANPTAAEIAAASSAMVTVTAIDDAIFDDFAQETIILKVISTSNANVSPDPGHNAAAIGILDNEPVIIDLDGDGVEFADNPVAFDIDNDGVKEAVAWAGGDDGFLAYDEDGSGTVNSAREIVFTEHAEGAETDLEAIRQAFDSDGDGLLTEADAEWDKFGIWQDENSDGVTDPGEFVSLEDLGVRSIGLENDGNAYSPADGVQVHGESILTYADGSTAKVADASLASIDELDVSELISEDGEVDLSEALTEVAPTEQAQPEPEAEPAKSGFSLFGLFKLGKAGKGDGAESSDSAPAEPGGDPGDPGNAQVDDVPPAVV